MRCVINGLLECFSNYRYILTVFIVDVVVAPPSRMKVLAVFNVKGFLFVIIVFFFFFFLVLIVFLIIFFFLVIFRFLLFFFFIIIFFLIWFLAL